LLSALETISARIREYDAQIEQLAEESYPEVALLKKVKGVGTLIALTYILTLEDPRASARAAMQAAMWDCSRPTELRGKRTSTAYHERRRLLSADGSGARRATYPGTVRRGLRSAEVGT
jgi:transposase